MDFSHIPQNPVYFADHGLADLSVAQHVTHLTHFPSKIESVVLILDNYLSELSKAILSLLLNIVSFSALCVFL